MSTVSKEGAGQKGRKQSGDGGRAALLLIGDQRGLVGHENWAGILNGVIDPLGRDQWEVDTFVCTTKLMEVKGDSGNGSEDGNENARHQLGSAHKIPSEVAQALNIRFVIRATNATIRSQNERIRQCFFRVREHELKHKLEYKFFVRGRPDQVAVMSTIV
jgi:hypothetical protein